jgi:F5/8 type C domain-containing protein
VTGIVLALGAHPGTYPRSFVVDVSPDQKSWTEVWRGNGAARAMVAAIETPRDVRISIDFAPTRARFVRIKQVGRSRVNPWGVAELRVTGNRANH